MAWALRRDSFKHRRGAGWGTGWRMLEETWARRAVGTWLEVLSPGKARSLQKTTLILVCWTSQCHLMLHCGAGHPKSALSLTAITANCSKLHHKLPLPHLHPPVPLPLSPSPSFMSQECEWGGVRCNRNQSHLIISMYHLKLGKEKAESSPTTWGQCYLSSWLVLLFTKKTA